MVRPLQVRPAPLQATRGYTIRITHVTSDCLSLSSRAKGPFGPYGSS